MAKYKLADAPNKAEGEPHPDWQLNYSYLNRFPWPEHKLGYHESVPTHAVFATTQEKQYEWLGGQQAVNVILTTILDFHKPHELFKKEAISLSKAMNISIQEPKKQVYFAQDRLKDD
jgi:hypothetical protein